MKRNLTLVLTVFVFILLGAGCSGNKNTAEKNEPRPESLFSWYLTASSTVILRDGKVVNEIKDVSSENTLPNDFVFFRQTEQYVFFGVRAKSDGYDIGFTKLYQLNIGNNQIVPVITSMSRAQEVYVADVSPDGRLAAFVLSDGTRNEIILKNIDGFSERRIEVNNKNGGIFVPKEAVWKLGDVRFSPDSAMLAYAFLEYYTDPKNPDIIIEAAGNFRVLDLQTKTVPVVETGYIPSKNKVVRVWGWKEDGGVNYSVEEEDVVL